MQLFGATTASKPNFYHIVYDICKDDRPSITYWAEGPVRGRLVVQGQVNTNMVIGVGEQRTEPGYKGPRRWSEEERFLGKARQRLEGTVCHRE